MATYKVIQDIEADDKLIGPLTMKQFVFACVACGFAFVAFMVASKTVIYAAIPFLPFIIVPGVLAAPLGRDQPTEIWLAAQIRFFIKPRKRIWDQSGIKELVTITAPKKFQKILTKGYSEDEVKSRLSALANTIDSRGWAVKNVDLNIYSPPSLAVEQNDRLVDFASLPQIVPDTDINSADDIMDYQNNALAAHFDEMVHQASKAQKDKAIDKMKAALRKESYKNLKDEHSEAKQVKEIHQRAEPEISETQEKELLEHVAEEKREHEMIKPHHKTIKTPEQVEAEEAARKKVEQAQAVSPLKNTDIINQTDGLSVASVQQLVNRKPKSNNEVVVHLR